jgi:hypothetical protein
MYAFGRPEITGQQQEILPEQQDEIKDPTADPLVQALLGYYSNYAGHSSGGAPQPRTGFSGPSSYGGGGKSFELPATRYGGPATYGR